MSENKKVPLIALRDLVVFPRMVTHFDCGRQKSIAAVEAAEINGSYVLLVAQKDSAVLEPKREDLFDYGTLAAIKQILKLPGGVVRVLVEGVKRAKIEEFFIGDSFYEAAVEEIKYESNEDDNQEVLAAMRLVEEDLENYTELDSRLIPGLLQSVVDSSSPESLVDTSAAYINLDLEKSQDLLETLDPFERLTKF
ncbi:MAG: LON peptidase substrate-binding domain-containing protein, partial [Peptoniphilus sp.]|uniref:LON peptidase substrate-binding domain-containing protein n=1 Tax=Peptoniphilus sp. TaxID=1971214 RepID=UPI002A75EC6F